MKKVKSNIFRAISIDGGGMLGYYSARYLHELSKLAINRNKNDNFRICEAFDMLVGTSTGAIIACGLGNKMEPEKIAEFYRCYGAKVFRKKMPVSCRSLLRIFGRVRANKKGDEAMREGLKEAFNDITLGDIYKKHKKPIIIPSTSATAHAGYVFKTPHNDDTNKRDNDISLVDACLASSAAPLYRSLARIGNDLFIDGGLWGNNPVLVALSEALRFTKGSDKKIEIYCLGISPEPGSAPDLGNPHWGFRQWCFGSKAVHISIDSQKGVFNYLAQEFSEHINREISIIRFPKAPISEAHYKLLSLDNASLKSMELMENLARKAGDETNRVMSEQDNDSGKRITDLLYLKH